MTARLSRELLHSSSFVVTLCQEDLATVLADAVVCPTNTFLQMNGEVASVLNLKAGNKGQLEVDAVEQGPIRIGDAVVTRGFDLPARWVIHSPTVEMPVDHASRHSVSQAIRAALSCAGRHNFRKIGVPAMGTGTGGISFRDSAQTILRDAFDPISRPDSTIQEISIVAFDPRFYDAVLECASLLIPRSPM
jgi:O-acetyl-ADP-ribose deacetylase